MTNRPVRYSIQSGTFPLGLNLNPNTGAITGVLKSENLGLGPVWNGPADGAKLTTASVADTINITTISASARSDRTIRAFSIVGSNCMPWGLTMNSSTGAITGKVAPLKTSQLLEPVTNPPIWTNAEGKLGTYGETTSVSLNLVATPQNSRTMKTYIVVKGGLPWGLSMNSANGQIRGTTKELPNPGYDVGLSPTQATPPLWTTAAGTVATYNEGTSNTLRVIATGQGGKTISRYHIVSGNLPWGLTLVTNSGGLISGVVSDIRTIGEAVVNDPTKDPKISDSYKVGSQTRVDSSEVVNIGSFAKGTNVGTIQFTTVLTSGRTGRMFVRSGELPLGLSLSSGGAITGVVSNTNYLKSGTYNFTLGVIDNTQAFSSRSYSITVL